MDTEKQTIGRILAVDERESTILFLDYSTQLNRTVPFPHDSGLGIVFQSMLEQGQPLVLSESAKEKLKFECAMLAELESIEKLSDGWLVRVLDAHPSFVLKDSNAKSQKLLEILQEGNVHRLFWFVPKAHEAQTGNRETLFHQELTDVLSASAVSDCDISKTYPFELAEPDHQAIDVAFAQLLLDELLVQSMDPVSGPLVGIPFLYPARGCDERSHLMARHILERGVFPFKVWVYGRNLKLVTRHDPKCCVEWAYHTAPAVMTDDGFKIIDPSVSEDILDIPDWYCHFSLSSDRHVYCVSHQFYFFPRSGCLIKSDPEYVLTERKLANIRVCLRLQSHAYGFPPCKSS